jgi:hypothetical protein
MPWRVAYIKLLRRYREICKLPKNITEIIACLIFVRAVGYNPEQIEIFTNRGILFFQISKIHFLGKSLRFNE